MLQSRHGIIVGTWGSMSIDWAAMGNMCCGKGRIGVSVFRLAGVELLDGVLGALPSGVETSSFLDECDDEGLLSSSLR